MATRTRSHRSQTSTPQSPGSLRGQVALVAGATRGAGRGIARALGEAGATVVVHRPERHRAAVAVQPP